VREQEREQERKKERVENVEDKQKMNEQEHKK
jgi:hypothetical protein